MAEKFLRSALVALFVLLPMAPETSDQRSHGAAHAQSLPSCAPTPKCGPGERVECERGTCARPHNRPVIGCVRATCVSVYGGALPKLIMRQCAAKPACGGRRVAVCTTPGHCAPTLHGQLVNGCLQYSCVSRL
jgi:hypothetical protein